MFHFFKYNKLTKYNQEIYHTVKLFCREGSAQKVALLAEVWHVFSCEMNPLMTQNRIFGIHTTLGMGILLREEKVSPSGRGSFSPKTADTSLCAKKKSFKK